MRRIRIRSLLLAATTLLLAGVPPGKAYNMPSYDLDSLVYLSSEVVEAQPIDGAGMKITRVWMGHLHPDEVIGFNEWKSYRIIDERDPYGVWSERSFRPEDHLTLFLRKSRAVASGAVKKKVPLFETVPSGVKLLDRGRIKGFAQHSNPGPYELEWTKPEQLPTPKEFQRQLTESIPRVDALRDLLTKKAGAVDLADLLSLLAQRKPGHTDEWTQLWRPHDAISEAACGQIVALANPEAIVDALAIGYQETLARAMESEAGRSLLLKVMGDAHEPAARRLGCARAVRDSFAWYQEEVNGDFLARLMVLCREAREVPGLTDEILEQLDSMAEITPSHARPPALPVRAQIVEGLPVLRQLYRETQSEKIRFAVEKLVLRAGGFDTYRNLDPACGPVASLVQPADLPSAGFSSASGLLSYESSIRWGDPSWREAADLRRSLLLVNVRTGERHILPMGSPVGGWNSVQDERAGGQASLPPTLPTGRYRIQMQLARPGLPPSIGHGFEADL